MKRLRLVDRIEVHPLSDGGLATISKFGRKYTFTRTYDSFEQPPDVHMGLTKAKAYEMLEEALKNDVLEVE